MKQLCRLCLEELKENNFIPIIQRELLDQIFLFTSIEITCRIGSFEKICRKCHSYIKVSNKFRTRCKETNEWLHRIIEWQKQNRDYSRIPTETIIRILRNQPEDDPLIDPILIKSQRLPPKPPTKKNAATMTCKTELTRDVSQSTRGLYLTTTRGIGTAPDDHILRRNRRDVGVSVGRKSMDIGIGTQDFDAPVKYGSRSIGVATSDWYWFHPKFSNAATSTDNVQTEMPIHVVDKWTSTDSLLPQLPNHENSAADDFGHSNYEGEEQDVEKSVKEQLQYFGIEEEFSKQASSIIPSDTFIGEGDDIQSLLDQVTCQFCFQVCSSVATWLTHCKEVHHDLFLPFVCHTCGADFQMKEHLNIHINVVHLELQHVECDLCGKIFFRKNELRTHVMMHLGERRYRCSLCPARYSIKSGLNRHLAQHKMVENEEAKKLTAKKSPLRKWPQSYMCLYCGKNFPSSEIRNAHEKNHSKTAINIENIINFNLLDIMDDDQLSNL